jgi:hypothetical protein
MDGETAATHNGVNVDDEVNPSPHLLGSLLLTKAGGVEQLRRAHSNR